MSKNILAIQISDMNILRNLLMNLKIDMLYIYGKSVAHINLSDDLTDEEILEKYDRNSSITHFRVDDINHPNTNKKTLYNKGLYKDIKGFGRLNNNLNYTRFFYDKYEDMYGGNNYTVEDGEKVISLLDKINYRYKLMSYNDNRKVGLDNKDDILITHSVYIYNGIDSKLKVSIYTGVDRNHAKYQSRIMDLKGMKNIYEILELNMDKQYIELYSMPKNFYTESSGIILEEYDTEELLQISPIYFNTINSKELYSNLLRGLDKNMNDEYTNYYISAFFSLMYIIRKYIVLNNDSEDVILPFNQNTIAFPVINIPKI